MRADVQRKRALSIAWFALPIFVLAPLFATRNAGAVDATRLHIDDASIGGRSLLRATASNPVRIPTRSDVPIAVTLSNPTQVPIRARALRVTVALLGVQFASYQASVDEDVPANSTTTIYRSGDFFDLDKAANGYVNAKLEVVDDRRSTIASQPFDASVNGRVTSSEGVTFLALVGLTLIGVVEILLRTARGQLSRNRFVRGLSFGFTAGCGALAVVMALAIVEVALVASAVWIPVVLIVVAAGFVLGYISPNYSEPDIGARTEKRVVDIVATEAVARASGNYARRTTGGTTAPHIDIRDSAHNSGGYAAPHDSGGYVPQHDSGSISRTDPSAG